MGSCAPLRPPQMEVVTCKGVLGGRSPLKETTRNGKRLIAKMLLRLWYSIVTIYWMKSMLKTKTGSLQGRGAKPPYDPLPKCNCLRGRSPPKTPTYLLLSGGLWGVFNEFRATQRKREESNLLKRETESPLLTPKRVHRMLL